MARNLLAFLVCVPVALLTEAYLTLELLVIPTLTTGHMLSMAALHLFASLLAAEGLSLRYAKDDPGAPGAWRTGLTLSLFLPVFGLIIVLLLVIRTPRTILVKIDDYISPMEYRKQQAELELAAEAEKGHAGVQVEAIGDALKDEDKAKRLGAVQALREIGDKRAVELLAGSLDNTVFEVRFHAVEALSGINKDFSNRIAKYTTAVERDPSAENHLSLAEVYYEYASLEMEEESIQQHLYRSALASYREYIGQRGKEAEVMLKAAVCLEALGEYPQARSGFKEVLATMPESFDAHLGMARLQYREGQFDQLVDTCRRIRSLPLDEPPEPHIADVVTLWAEGPQAGAR